MLFRLRTVLAGSALVLGAIVGSTALPPPAAAAGAVAPYCIATGSGEGGGLRTGRCEFFDYQACLQAAASGGNCVQNIDYHGDTATTAPAAGRSRRSR